MESPDLQNFSTADKLKLVTQLWDEIAASEESIIVPHEVIVEVKKRSSEMIADPSIAIDEVELWRRVDG